MIAIYNNKLHILHTNVSKTRAAEIVGVDRSTILRWEKKRTDDKSFKEVYNFFDVYFNPIDESKKPYLVPMQDARRT